MIRINLLPFRAARKKENIRLQLSVFLLSLVLISIILFWYHVHLSNVIASLNESIDRTQKQVDEYNKQAQEVEKLKKELAILKQKLEIIASLQAGRSEAFEIMDTMRSMVIEKRMWFTSFEAVEQVLVTTKGEGQNAQRIETVVTDIKINGIALDNKTVADFMARLEKSDYFVNVKLMSIKQEIYRAKADVSLKSFFLVCQKHPPKKAEKS